MSQVPQIAVIGDGSWATALIQILSEQEVNIKWWVRRKESARLIRAFGHNPRYLTNVNINLEKVQVETDIHKAVEGVSVVVLVVPAAFVKDALDQLEEDAFEGKIVVSAIKGMIPEMDCLVTDYVQERFGVDEKHLTIIAGPCHAEEVALRRQSYLTIGCENEETGEEVAALLRCSYVNVHTLPDLVGIEYAAVMKNIVALACGITHGLNFGDNFQAVLVSNALQEISRFLDALFPGERDLSQSAYLGDLLVTSYSQFSRNRTLGNMLGRGYTVKSAMVEMGMIAEGYYAVKSLHKIYSEAKLDLPICQAVYHILYERISPAVEVEILKGRLQ